VNYQEKWSRNIQALHVFVENYGHANVPSAYSVDIDGKILFLGPWVSKVRAQHRNGKLVPHKARELEAIPGWHWNSSRPGPRVSGGRDTTIIERHAAGESTRQIAEELNLTTQRVNQILRKAKQ
jgi:DNA-binding NarL/FixJ family response regulator